MWRALPDRGADEVIAPERGDPRREVDLNPGAHRAPLPAAGMHGELPPERRPDQSAQTDAERRITTRALRLVWKEGSRMHALTHIELTGAMTCHGRHADHSGFMRRLRSRRTVQLQASILTRRVNGLRALAPCRLSVILATVCVLAAAAGVARAGIDATGAFTSTVAVKVPSYHRLQPGLALRYSSRSGNGFTGVGWTLAGTSTIRRESGLHGLPDWDGADHFALDGERLIACAGASQRVQASPSCAHPVAGTVAYTTTIESYKRIAFTPDGSGGTWTVWNRNGVATIYRPVTVIASGVLDWRTTTVRDLSGNTVAYHWTSAVGQQPELSSINYGDTVLSFKTESRPDPITSATGGGLLVDNDRLAQIDETAGGQPVRSYRLTYAVHAGRSGESFLQSVQEFGGDGKTSLPATTFDTTARHQTTDWLAPVSAPLSGLASNWPSGPTDAGRWDETLNGASQGSLGWPAPPGQASWLAGDLNRDERQDVVQVHSAGLSIGVDAEMNRDGGGYGNAPRRCRSHGRPILTRWLV